MPTPVKEPKNKDQHPDLYPQGNPGKAARAKAVRRSWLILAAVMALYALVFAVIFFLEPGIR